MTAYMIAFLWAAQAFVEYKIIDAAPEWVEKIFHHKIGGIVLSIAIGTAVAYALGIPNGFIVGAANFIGLATNNLTYPAIKGMSRRGAQVKTYVNEHPQTVSDFKAGITALFKFIGAVFVLIGKLCRWIGAFLTFCCHPVASTKGWVAAHSS